MSIDSRLDSICARARRDDDPPFKKGDKVKENRSGAKVETVSVVHPPMVYTYENPNSGYHWTKLVKA